MLRTVLDTSVLVSAYVSRTGLCQVILLKWSAGEFDVIASPKLLAELDRALLQPKIAKSADLTSVPGYIAWLEQRCVVVADPPNPPAVTRDPNDDYIVALAKAAQVQVIVSGDRDLLEADIDPIAVTPREFLDRLSTEK